MATTDAGAYLLAKSYSDGDAVGSVSTPWTYDEAGRLKAIPGHVNSFFYNARGQVTAANYANNVATTNTYNDQRNWLLRVVTSSGATNIQDVNYTREYTGRIAAVTAKDASGVTVPAESWLYTYDSLDRLTFADNLNGTSLDQSFSYDLAHNILTNSAVGTYAYPAAGAVRPHAVTTAGSYTLAYDAAGNMTSKTGGGVSNTLTWDAENKLTRVLVGGLGYNHVHDANHARVLKVVDASGGNPERATIYLGGVFFGASLRRYAADREPLYRDR